MYDAVILGAGLAGLAAARDLAHAGLDVVVVEGRDRPGGRVLSTQLDDGRLVQLGGELIGTTHIAYLELVAELGLTVRDAYVSEPGQTVWDLDGEVGCGDPAPWMSEADHDDYARVVSALVDLAKSVDPDDPWGHPHAGALDAMSFEHWLRHEAAARPGALRMFEAAKAGLAADSLRHTSLLAELRKMAVAGDQLQDYYDIDQWTRFTVAEGSATVALRMAAELGERIQYGSVVTAVDVTPEQVTVTLADGRLVRGRNVVCALPVAPLREIAITGVSAGRRVALHRIRNSLTAKVVVAYREPFWRAHGKNGSSYGDGVLGSTWVQGPAVLSALVPPAELAFFLAGDPSARERDVRRRLQRMFGEGSQDIQHLFTRQWSMDPFTLGYMAHYAPGDLAAIGPMHARHEPPFFVAGSDYWVAGYMEGAVRTGRSAARALLAR